MVEYDPATNTMTRRTPDTSGQAVNFINLPNGQVLAAAGDRDWIYTPSAPQGSWRPTVTSVTANGDGSCHLTGTQLTGFVTAGEDDYQDPQNLPIVYLKDSAGHVFYARFFNFSTMAPSTPGEVESADFTLPSGLLHSTYSLYVSACGVFVQHGIYLHLLISGAGGTADLPLFSPAIAAATDPSLARRQPFSSGTVAMLSSTVRCGNSPACSIT